MCNGDTFATFLRYRFATSDGEVTALEIKNLLATS